MPTEPIDVVAAVIGREGRYLLGRRPEGKRHGGLWEFPGGKLLDGETLLEAARRELREELDMSAASIGRTLASVRDEGSRFTIHFVEVEASGTPVPHEHSEVGWFTSEELAGMALAPADARFLAGSAKPARQQ